MSSCYTGCIIVLSLFHLTKSHVSYNSDLIQAATGTRSKSSSNLPSFLKPLSCVPSRSLTSTSGTSHSAHLREVRGTRTGRLQLRGAEVGMGMMVPRHIVQGKGGRMRGVEWAGINPQAIGPTGNYIMMPIG